MRTCVVAWMCKSLGVLRITKSMNRNNKVLVPALLIGLLLASTGCKQEVEDDSKYTGSLFTENIRSTDARTPDEEKAGFKLPPGFEIELFASEPNIDKPINIAFDAKGRMWVTQSFEYPFPSSSTPKGTDRITILEDTDNDGKADRFTDVVDTVNIPIGILPLNDGAVTFSIPNIYKYSDTNNDGKIEKQKILYGPFGYQDTHGMVSNFMRGYDGWVYVCHGFTNRSTVAGTDGDSIRMISGNTFRFRMDGSRVEQMTFGQVNPFGLVFDAMGYVYSTDSHSSPLYQLIRGGDYPHFGKMEIMAFAPDMKRLENEATALCGISQYADVKFPAEFQGNFFIGDVVNCRVHRYSSVFKGATPVGKSETDFVKSEDPWFRPVNIKLGPDGAIYIADFYNAIIGHYEVPLGHPKRDKSRGRIWRITYKGQHNDRRNLTAASLDELLTALDLDNLPSRMAATDQISDRIGSTSVPAIYQLLSETATSPRKYVQALWLLHRMSGLNDEILKKSMAHADPLVRLHTMRVLTEGIPDVTFYPLIVDALDDKDPHIQRAAVELVMRYPTIASVEAVLSLQHKVAGEDSHLIYTTQLCLRNLLRNDVLLNAVVGKSWKQEDAASMAFVMVDVPSAPAAVFLSDYINTFSLQATKMPLAYQQVARFIPAGQLTDVILRAMRKNENDIDLQSSIFKGIQEGINQRGGKGDDPLFNLWGTRIAEGLLKKYPLGDISKSEEVISFQKYAIQLIGDYKMHLLEPTLKVFLQRETIDLDIRTAVLRSLMKIAPERSIELAGRIIQNDSTDLEFRKEAVVVLGEFQGVATNKVLGEVKQSPPDLQVALVRSLSSTAEGKDIIFRNVRRGDIMARTLMDRQVVERILLNISPKQQKEFDDLTAHLPAIDNERQLLIEARMKEFGTYKQASIQLDSGQQVYNRNCSVCHRRVNQAAGIGIGPQLHGIGKRGALALVEKILDPNRNISEAFRSYTLRMKDGKILTGLYRRTEGVVIVFADLTGKEFSVPKKDILEQKLSRFTIMPDNFGTTMSQEEFNALLAYLMNS